MMLSPLQILQCMLVFCCLWKAAEAVVGGDPAAPPEPDAAVVFTQKHGHSARLEGVKDDRLGYYAFVGIRYAEPPVGARRFQRPIRRLLAGELNATKNCLPCPQPDPRDSRKVIGHEDCLCLNVFAPKMPGEESGSPVVFFIHGGNYRSGSISSYGGQHLAKKDTILVTAQYRLGSLGYLSTGEREASGNAGLFDLRAAMTWIDDYIEFFNGDPTRIVIMGQGSGGSAAPLLALSSESRSAKGVASLSGAPLSPGAVKNESAAYAKAIADNTGCPLTPAERLLRCLRSLPVEKIIQVDKSLAMDIVDTQGFLNEISGRSGTGARVEGEDDYRGLPPLLTTNPAELIRRNRERCPLLIGVTSKETTRAVFGKYRNFLTSQLATIKDFIKKDIIGGLQNVVEEVYGLTQILQPLQFQLNSLNPLQQLNPLLTSNSTQQNNPLGALMPQNQSKNQQATNPSQPVLAQSQRPRSPWQPLLPQTQPNNQQQKSTLQKVSQLMPPLALPDFYQAFFDNTLKAVDGLFQIIEATGDALFNFPAYQSLQAWSQGAPAYFYSFEHLGNLSRGSHFLPSLVLTDKSLDNTADVDENINKGPSHGDELAYIFEALDEEGKPVDTEISSTDARVRDAFVDLIVNFARDLRPAENRTKLLFGFIPYTPAEDHFIRITDQITLDKNFRYCQMALWGNMADRFNTASCKTKFNQIIKLPKLEWPPKFQIPTLFPNNNNNGNINPLVPNLLPNGGNNNQPNIPLINNPIIPNLIPTQTQGGKKPAQPANPLLPILQKPNNKKPQRPTLFGLGG